LEQLRDYIVIMSLSTKCILLEALWL